MLAKTKAIFQGYRQAKPHEVIQKLNPIQSWRWAKRRHPNKPKRWVKERYFTSVKGNNWMFTGVNEDGKQRYVFKASPIPIKRHCKIRHDANPYDPDWDEYFEKRQYKIWLDSNQGQGKLRGLWKRQEGICPICGQTLNDKTNILLHRIIPKSQGGEDVFRNLILVHPNCKQQARHLAKLGYTTLLPVPKGT